MSSRPITIKDIAANCGVSKSTVSAALRGESTVKEETKIKVLAAAEKLGYDPAAQEMARRLRARAIGDENLRRSKVVALLFPSDLFSAAHFTKMAEGAMEVLNRSGYGILLTGWDDENEEQVPLHPAFSRGEIDGMIASYSPILKPGPLKKLRANPGFGDKPIISLMRSIPKCHSVISDTFQGGYLTVKRLLDLGHRRILFVIAGGDDTTPAELFRQSWMKVTKDKWRGMSAAFAERGLDAESHMITISINSKWGDPRGLPENRVIRPTSDWLGRGAQILLETLDSNPDITAIIAHNDPCAFRIWCTLLVRGIDIPRDMTLFGFDDSDPIYNAEGGNLLSTIHLPLVEMGRAAGSLAIKLIEGKSEDGYINMALPPSLIERESSGPVNQ